MALIYPLGLAATDFSDGESGTSWQPQSFIYGGHFSIGASGTVTQMGVKVRSASGTIGLKFGLYTSGGSLVASATGSVSSGTQAWVDSGTFSQAVSAGTYYVLVSAETQNALYGYDTSGSGSFATEGYSTAMASSETITDQGDTGQLYGVRMDYTADPSATLDQNAFRWGTDDGSESAHGWAAAENTNLTAAADSTYLLRAQVEATGNPAALAYTLRSQKNGSGGYVAVPIGPPAAASVTWGAVGTAASGTTSCAPRYPTGISASTSKIYCLVTGRSNTANTAPTMPAGWTNVADLEGGTGTWGVDAGTRRATLFRKDTVLGTETGTVTVSLAGTTANTLRASIFRVEVPAGHTIDEAFGTGQDSTNATSFSVTSGTALSWAADDLLIYGIAQNIDTGTHSAQSITASGVTFGTRTNRASTAVTNGNDHRHILESVPVTTGSGSSAPTYAATGSTSISGAAVFARFRSVPDTREVYVVTSANITAGGEATTARLTAPSGKTTGDFVTGRRWDDENGTDTIDITTDDYTEFEWCLKVAAGVPTNDYFDFRVYAGASALDTYTVTPRWTIGAGVATSVPFRRPGARLSAYFR